MTNQTDSHNSPATADYHAFNVWLEAVDAAVGKLTGGLSYLDLPDVCFTDLHEDGYSPVRAARYVIRNAKE